MARNRTRYPSLIAEKLPQLIGGQEVAQNGIQGVPEAFQEVAPRVRLHCELQGFAYADPPSALRTKTRQPQIGLDPDQAHRRHDPIMEGPWGAGNSRRRQERLLGNGALDIWHIGRASHFF